MIIVGSRAFIRDISENINCNRPNRPQLKLLHGTEELLTCKVCRCKITPPIFVCHKGHCLCYGCRTKGSTCPICNKFRITEQFTIFNKILRVLPRRCKYFAFGCNKILPGNSQHDKYCIKRQIKCRLGKDKRCGWMGGYNDWLEHVLCLSHRTEIFITSIKLMFIQLYEFRSQWEVYNILLEFDSSLFMLYFFKSEKFLHVTAQYIGQLSFFKFKFPEYGMKLTFLKDSVTNFSVTLNSENEKMATSEGIPLSRLAPLINDYEALDLYVELQVDHLPHILDLDLPE